MLPQELDGAKVIMYLENCVTNNYGIVSYEDQNPSPLPYLWTGIGKRLYCL